MSIKLAVMFVGYVIQLGTINKRNEIDDRKGLERDLKALKNIGVDGVMVDCWWGLVEGKGPQKYTWSGYRDLFSLVRELKLKLQVPIASFLSLVRRLYSMWVIGYKSYNEVYLIDIAHSPAHVQVVMSFHQCGGNIGDDVYITLPKWVLEVQKEDPDIFFRNKEKTGNPECLSWGVDTERLLRGRTAAEVSSVILRCALLNSWL